MLLGRNWHYAAVLLQGKKTKVVQTRSNQIQTKTGLSTPNASQKGWSKTVVQPYFGLLPGKTLFIVSKDDSHIHRGRFSVLFKGSVA